MRCLGKISSGKRCKLNCDYEYCHLHQNQICPICLNQKKNNTKSEKCVHSFCKECIYNWLYFNVNCPCCRKYMGDNLINEARIDGIRLNKIKIVTVYRFFIRNEFVKTIVSSFCEMDKLIRYDAWVIYYNNLNPNIKNLLRDISLQKKTVIGRPCDFPGRVYIYFT